MRCKYCGSDVPEGAYFCPSCGKRVESEEQYQDEEAYSGEDLRGKLTFLAPIAAIAAVLIIGLVAYVGFIKPKLGDKLDVDAPTETIETAGDEQDQSTEDTSQGSDQDTGADNAASNVNAEFPKSMYVNVEEGLILRKGPGTENDMIYIMSYGDEVQIEKIENGWAYGSIKGNSGWCSAEYITDDKTSIKPKEKNMTTADPKKLVAPENTAEQGFHGYVFAEEGVNMRYGPGTQYDIITALPYNAEAIERGWQDGWIYIEYKGKFGWVSGEYFGMRGGREKPAIYLYPTKTEEVKVKVILNTGEFTKTIPESLNGEWTVTASPSGCITDAKGKVHDYIFWESTDDTDYDWSEGYVVSGREAEEFLEGILPKMGLNVKETRQFIEYWLPRLQKNKFNLVTFQGDCYTETAELEVYPKPDSLMRLFMVFKKLEEPISITAPDIVPFAREGFTVVEWGGAEIK